MTSVVLIGDYQIVRHGLRMSLESNENVEVLGESGYGQEAIDMLRALKPDVAFLDVSLSIVDAVEEIRKLAAADPSAKILVLTMQQNARMIKMMTEAGAVGFLTKNSTPQDFVDAVDVVAKGGFYLKSEVAAEAFRELLTGAEPKPALSRREIDVIRLISENYDIDAISELLSITPRTVQTHLYHAMKKLDLHSRKELVRYAVEEGLIPIPA